MSAWLLKHDLISLTGWTARHVEKQVAAGKLSVRSSQQKAANGRAIPEFDVDSLPAEILAKIAPPAPLSIAESPKFTQALQPFDLEKVAFATAAEEQQARERYAILEPLLTFDTEPSRYAQLRLEDGSAVTSATRMEKYLSAKHNVSDRALRRWRARYRQGGLVALADRPRGDKGKSRFFEENQAAAEFVAAKYWSERLNVRNVYRALKRDAAQLGVNELPCYDTVRAFLAALPQAPGILARRGEQAFNSECLPYLSREYGERANQIWVSDHMIADVLTWDDVFERNAAPIRMRLTMLLDFRTRKAIGWTFCQEGSSYSISTALRNGILQYGPCESFYCDNGKDYRKVAKGAAPQQWWAQELNQVTGLLAHLGIAAQHCLRYHPQSKHVERFFNTLHSQFDSMFTAGYTTGNPFLRPDATHLAVKEHHRMLKSGEVEGSPLPPASVYIAAFGAWVEQEYNQAPHSGKGMDGRSPNDIYDEQYPLPQRPRIALDRVAHLFYESARRKVDSCGIRLDRNRYVGVTAEDDAALLMRTSEMVDVRYDRNDPNLAVALDDAGRLIARLRPELLITQSAEAQPLIAQSMADRRRLQKSVTSLVRGVTRKVAQDGHLTERQHLELAAGLDAPESSTALSLVTHRAPRPTATQVDTSRLQSEDIADRLSAFLGEANV